MTDIQFINLTPHIINLQKFDGTTLELPPSGTVARVEEARATARMIGDMGVSLASYGEVVNLPAPKPWTCYIVSSLVLAAVPERPDVFAPGPAIRNEAGQVIGANGLSCTPSYARLNPVDEPAHPAPSYAEAARDNEAAIKAAKVMKECGCLRHGTLVASQSKTGYWLNDQQFSTFDDLLDEMRKTAPIHQWTVQYTPMLKPRLNAADERREMESRWD